MRRVMRVIVLTKFSTYPDTTRVAHVRYAVLNLVLVSFTNLYLLLFLVVLYYTSGWGPDLFETCHSILKAVALV